MLVSGLDFPLTVGMYEESHEMLLHAPTSDLKTRLNFHISHKLKDEASLMENHQNLQDILEDQLSLAAIHYLRAHYQEAIDIYKRLLIQNRYFCPRLSALVNNTCSIIETT